MATRFAADCRVLRHGSAALVALAEARLRGEETDDLAYRAVLSGLLDQPDGDRIDVIVNACTHFPLLAPELGLALPGVTQVDGGPGIARRIAFLTRNQPWPVQPSPGIAVFTGGGPNVQLRQALAQFRLSDIRHV